MKPETIDKRHQRREANRQKQPWPLRQIGKFDKGLHKNDPGQHPAKGTEELLTAD